MSQQRGGTNSRKVNPHLAVFQQYANRITSSSKLSGITLAHVLAGDTCYPISLVDFEAYLAHKEYSLENLQFVVWFQDYRKRFLALPEDQQETSPGSKAFTFTVPSPARTAQRVADSKRKADELWQKGGPPTLSQCSSIMCPQVQDALPFTRYAGLSTPNSPLLPSSFEQSAGSFSKPRVQPFRTECARVIATFFKPGAAKELPLDPILRDAVIRDLTFNTHPDIFLPAYEEIYHMLETISLPRFLSAASANINLPKQLFWYAMGAVNMLLGIVVAVVLITTIHAPPESSRAWRLFAVPLAGIGFMQAYSAWRGFCSQVWGRGHIQLRVWEMQEMDEEAASHWGNVLKPDTADTTTEKVRVEMTEQVKWEISEDGRAQPHTGTPSLDMNVDDKGAIAPFMTGDDSEDSTSGSSSSAGSVDGSSARPPPIPSRPSSVKLFVAPRIPRLRIRTPVMVAPSKRVESDVEDGYKRPPIFGPEKVVLDPRIQALHRQVMRDMLWVGCWSTLAFTALVLSVPPLHR